MLLGRSNPPKMNASYMELGEGVIIANLDSEDGREGPLVQEFVAGSYISQSDLLDPPQTKTTLPEDDEVVITAQECLILVLSIDATCFQLFFAMSYK